MTAASAAEPAPPARLAATAVLLRTAEAAPGFEVLMLRRAPQPHLGGFWVFPGGRVDKVDGEGDAALLAAAVRELAEETALVVAADELVPFAFWVPPMRIEKSFHTTFFLGAVDASADVQVDGKEIDAFEWLLPAEVLRRHGQGELDMRPPTWMTVNWLAAHPDVPSALAAARERGVAAYITHSYKQADGGFISTWEPDVAYDSGQFDLAGPRHRLHIPLTGPWTLELD